MVMMCKLRHRDDTVVDFTHCSTTAFTDETMFDVALTQMDQIVSICHYVRVEEIPEFLYTKTSRCFISDVTRLNELMSTW
ncbi:hypothetical protein NQ315_000365 [Exocentrus adspersus]|uniref:Uncharacterized protein n=1 Tax=Exocentrus adspersus TaxID=1586481 RepID=A0AAV8VLL6_9CUCU|nr:hypothetical protein NQ315_000365 [Exocentrus adspersus]